MSGVVETWDVIVAGGGPAGTTVATHLARLGHAVLVCDAARFPRHKICGEYLPPAAGPAFERLGAGAAIRALGPLRPVGMAVVAPGGAVVLGRYGARGTAGYSLRRCDLDHALLRHAAASGVEVREATRVTGFTRAADGTFRVELTTSGPSPPEACGRGERPRVDHIRARVLVGADGRNSFVARRLGLRGTIAHRRFAVMGHFQGVRLPADHGEMIVTPYGYCGINPLPGGLANVCIVIDPRRAGVRLPGRGGLRQFFDRAIAAIPATRERMEGAALAAPLRATGPIACAARRSVSDGALLVGDAAGFFDPFTGEGINMALRGGEMAAETLAAALRAGDLREPALRPYAARREAAFAARLRLDRLLQVLLRSPALTDFVARRLTRNQDLADLLARVTGDMVSPAVVFGPRFAARLLLS
jgi:flavin-dependent dehydrogenase